VLKLASKFVWSWRSDIMEAD